MTRVTVGIHRSDSVPALVHDLLLAAREHLPPAYRDQSRYRLSVWACSAVLTGKPSATLEDFDRSLDLRLKENGII